MARPAALWAALLLAAVACAPTAAAQALTNATNATGARPVDPYFEGRTINVCTSDYEPIMRCLDRDPSEYTG